MRERKAVPAHFEDFVFILPPERLPTVHRPFPEIQDWSSLRIRLKREACLGSCPVYDLEIRGDGKVEYNGKSDVAVLGTHEGAISHKDLEILVDSFRKADFFSLDPKYSRNDISDGSSITMSLDFDNQAVSVVDYWGAEAGMPESAEALENAIDRYGGAYKWTDGDKNTVPALKREGFDFHSKEAGSALAVAARRGDLTAVQNLVAAGAPLGMPSLHILMGPLSPPLDGAVRNDDIEVLRHLIKAGASK